MSDLTTPQERDAKSQARSLLRRWLEVSETEAMRSIDAVGQRAVAAACDVSARLETGVSASQAAEQGLQELELLAKSMDASSTKRIGSFLTRGRERNRPKPPSIETLIDQLDRHRDGVARSLLCMETDRGRLRAAADLLDDALALIRACAQAAESAARELAFAQPESARFLREVLGQRVLAREQDILTQAVVTEQGILTLSVLTESQDALVQALGRARDTSISALRTAAAARSAVTSSLALTAQAAALDQTAAAVGMAAEPRPALQRALNDAVAQARRAISAHGAL